MIESKKNLCRAVLVTCLISLTSCDRDQPERDPIIVATGNLKFHGAAVYWQGYRHFDRTDLNDYSNSSARALDVFVSGNDVFLAGYRHDNTTGKEFATYWKNGTAIRLSEDAVANSIFVSDGVVYTAGGFWSPGAYLRKPVYWKNSETIVLNESWGEAHAIVKSGRDLYIVGTSHADSNYPKAALWLNGALQILPDGSVARDVAVSRGNVHVVGYDDTIGPPSARYWRNGESNHLPKGRIANSVFVHGDDVLIAGITTDLNACYWKNGELFEFNGVNSEANSIMVHNGDLFIGGTSGGACYWKNDLRHVIDNTAQPSGCNSIFVR